MAPRKERIFFVFLLVLFLFFYFICYVMCFVKTYHGAVSDLDWLKEVHVCLCGLAGDVVTGTVDGCVVHLPSQIAGLEGCDQVGDNSGHTEVQSILWNVLEGEGVLDNSLRMGEGKENPWLI